MLVLCKQCNIRVLPQASGHCPNCQEAVAPSLDSSPPLETKEPPKEPENKEPTGQEPPKTAPPAKTAPPTPPKHSTGNVPTQTHRDPSETSPASPEQRTGYLTHPLVAWVVMIILALGGVIAYSLLLSSLLPWYYLFLPPLLFLATFLAGLRSGFRGKLLFVFLGTTVLTGWITERQQMSWTLYNVVLVVGLCFLSLLLAMMMRSKKVKPD